MRGDDMADSSGTTRAGAEADVDLLALLKEEGGLGMGLNPERYQVTGEVARGGMGVILRVRDKGFRRDLAMKVLPKDEIERDTEYDSRTSRFLEEAQVTGQLEHPGVVPVHEVGLDDERQLYFTMRLVKGKTFGEVIKLSRAGEEGWTTTRALGVLLKVCETMAFAHDKGVVHRDLKPDNVMVGRFGETYVMDWGLARVTGRKQRADPDVAMRSILTTARKDSDSSQGSSTDTLEGDVVGTPAYMPPEQARGELERLGPRSDVYSLGAMLYHLLAGEAPYAAERGPARVLAALLEGPPDALEGKAGDASAELLAICQKAMAREPEARYESMLAFADDLHAYLDDRVVRAYRTGAVIELTKWVRRNRGLAASLVLALGLALAGLGGVSYVQTRARGEVEAKNLEVEAKNVELEATNLALETARTEIAAARDRAVEGEREALWQSYVGNLGAALASLESGGASEARRRLAACAEELRGWEWRYLNERADGSLRTLDGIPTFVYALDVHPSDSIVAAAGGGLGDAGVPDHGIRLWDYESGELLRVLEGHTTAVMSLAFSPGGDALVSADIRGSLRLWDAEGGEVIATTESGFGGNVDYHPDGRRIAVASLVPMGQTAGMLRRVALWDGYEQRVLQENLSIEAHSNAVRFSPDGSLLALAGQDGRIRLLDSETLEPVRVIEAGAESRADDQARTDGMRGPGVFDVAFSPDGERLASGSIDGFVRTFDVETGKRLGFFRGHTGKVLSVAWHPRGPWIASSDDGGMIRFWDAETAIPLDVLRGHDGDVFMLGFSQLGDRLLSSSFDTTVRAWDGQPGANDTSVTSLSMNWIPPFESAFSPDGERIAWRRDWRQLRITDVRTGEDLATLWGEWGERDVYSDLRFSPSGERLHTQDVMGNLRTWDGRTGQHLAVVETGLIGPSARFDPACERVVVSSDKLYALDVASGEVLWAENSEQATTIDFTPDGRRLAVGILAGRLALRDSESGELLWYREHPGRVMGVVVDPAGEWIATTTFNAWDDSIFLFDLESGEPIDTFVGHAQPIHLSVAPDSSRIVSGNWDGTLSMWSPARGEVFTLPAHSTIVADVAFSDDGTVVASLGTDGRARLWNATPVESRAGARRAAARRRHYADDARARVDALLPERILVRAVVEALEADTSLEPEQRKAAIREVRTRGDEPRLLTRHVARIAQEAGRPPAAYLYALEAARYFAELYPEFSLPQDVLAMVEVRMGMYREAVARFERAEQRRREERAPGEVPAVFHLMRALAHHAVGDVVAAKRQLGVGRFQQQRGPDPWFGDAQALLEEVDALVGTE